MTLVEGYHSFNVLRVQIVGVSGGSGPFRYRERALALLLVDYTDAAATSVSSQASADCLVRVSHPLICRSIIHICGRGAHL